LAIDCFGQFFENDKSNPKSKHSFWQKMNWAIFPQTHLVTLQD
jgi:hypothetical protein